MVARCKAFLVKGRIHISRLHSLNREEKKEKKQGQHGGGGEKTRPYGIKCGGRESKTTVPGDLHHRRASGTENHVAGDTRTVRDTLRDRAGLAVPSVSVILRVCTVCRLSHLRSQN